MVLGFKNNSRRRRARCHPDEFWIPGAVVDTSKVNNKHVHEGVRQHSADRGVQI